MGMWKIDRDSGLSKALAVAEKGDTIEGLALKMGLDPREYKKWLSVALTKSLRSTVPSSSSVKMKGCEMYWVPNTMLLAWNGHLGYVGRAVSWVYAQELWFKAQGFKVDKLNRPDAATMRSSLAARWNDKTLHGFFFQGHGTKKMLQPIFYSNLKKQWEKLGKAFWIDNSTGLVGSARVIPVGSRFPFYATNDTGISGFKDPTLPQLAYVYQTNILWDSDAIAVKQYGLSVLKLWSCFSADGEWQRLRSIYAKSTSLTHGLYYPIINL